MDRLQQQEMFVQKVGTSGRSSAPQPTDARTARPYLSLQILSPSRSDHTASGSAFRSSLSPFILHPSNFILLVPP
jgi:hypothetical protein